jgi:hypothetical protein
MPTDIWSLRPGDTITRKQLHEQFGGRTQGGISPSKGSPNVFLFTDLEVGPLHGYFDGLHEGDDCFHYYGEGQYGDQRMVSGNASVLRHRQEGRHLRLFEVVRGKERLVQYLGEYELDSARPYFETDAPETGGGAIRKVFVFRLRPITATSPVRRPPDPPALRGVTLGPSEPQVDNVPVEDRLTEKSIVDPAREPYEAERRESALVHSLRQELESRGYEVLRLRIVPKGEFKPLLSDLWIPELKLLIEAKGTVTREAVRMALGQLADYSRFVKAENRAILLPSRPREDLEDLGGIHGVSFIWPKEGVFEGSKTELLPDSVRQPNHNPVGASPGEKGI